MSDIFSINELTIIPIE